MKALYFLFLFIFFGCSQFQKTESIQRLHTKRNPATIGNVYSSCKDQLISFFRPSSSDKNMLVTSRIARSKAMKKALSDGDYKKAISILKESHDNQEPNFKAGHFLKGRDPKREKKLRKLRNKTKAHFVPNYFQDMRPGQEEWDTFSTIIAITDNNIKTTEFELAAIEDAYTWIDHYKNYWDRIEETMRNSQEAVMKIEAIDTSLYKGEVNFEISIPHINESGKIEMNDIPFANDEDLKSYIDVQKEIYNGSRAVNKIDDYLKAGQLYQTMQDQAVMYRRIDLLYRRLAKTGRSKLGPEQQELLDNLKDIIENRPELRPRSDMIAVVQNKELSSERWASIVLWRSKRYLQNAKYPIPSSVQLVTEKLSRQAIITNFFGIIGGAASAAAWSGIALPLQGNIYSQYFLASFANTYNDLRLEYAGTTQAMEACKDAKTKAQKNNTLANFIDSHTSVYSIKTRLFKDYDHNLDKKLISYKKYLGNMCTIARSKKRVTETFNITKVEVKKTHRESLDIMYLNIIKETHADGETVANLVEEILKIHRVESNSDSTKKALNKFSENYQDEASEIKKYLSKVDNAAKQFQKIDSYPKYRNKEEFLDRLNKKYKDGELVLIEEE